MIKPYYQDDWTTVYNGDVREILKELPKDIIQCCVTSPPYWGLRDYGNKKQIGLEKTPEEYVEKLKDIFNLTKQIMKENGTLWLNLGDSYSASGRAGKNKEYMKRHKTFGKNGRNIGTFGLPQRVPKGLKPKDLVGIPWRVAFVLQADGWYLRSDIIWNKPNPMPESVTDRPSKNHEYIFLLAKSQKYYYDYKTIKEKTITKDNSVRNRDITKLNNTPGRSKMGGLKVNNYDYKNKKTVWTITTKPYSEAHFAVYPPDLIKPCILAGCPKSGIVLDPFGGSGTTGAVAKLYKRKSIIIELNKEYCELIVNRIKTAIPGQSIQDFSKSKLPSLRLFDI